MKKFIVILLVLSGRTWAVPAEGHKLMVAGPSPYAVEVTKKISQMGGNAADAAVAVGLTLGVTSPYFAALGGGGFAMVKMGKDVEALDFREMAPKAYNKDSFLALEKSASLDGGHAVGVPGMAAGLFALHKKYGKLPWSKVIAFPIQLAEQGFQLSGEWVWFTNQEKHRFTEGGRKYFEKPKGNFVPGEFLKQPQLARALKEFRDKQLKGFYEGPVAADIVQSVKAAGGRMSLEDLKNYKVRWLKPVETDFAGHHIYLMPPPSSGGVVIKTALKLIELTNIQSLPPFSVDELNVLGQIEARAFRGRALLGDPDFHKNPLTQLLSEKYIADLAKSIRKDKVAALDPLPESFGKESSETTHFSVMDNDGHAVAMTITLNDDYGSGVVTEKYGIALNNEMDDFTTRPGQANMFGLIQGLGNVVEPGKRPLSSMSPTLVAKDGKIVMALGAPGGPRIITAVLQVMYRVLAREMDVDEAVQAPRVHHQFQPNTLFVEPRLPPESIQGLRDRGNKVELTNLAKVYVVRRNSKGWLEGAFDSRAEGATGGF